MPFYRSAKPCTSCALPCVGSVGSFVMGCAMITRSAGPWRRSWLINIRILAHNTRTHHPLIVLSLDCPSFGGQRGTHSCYAIDSTLPERRSVASPDLNEPCEHPFIIFLPTSKQRPLQRCCKRYSTPHTRSFCPTTRLCGLDLCTTVRVAIRLCPQEPRGVQSSTLEAPTKGRQQSLSH
jgi:hypothetical protein